MNKIFLGLISLALVGGVVLVLVNAASEQPQAQSLEPNQDVIAKKTPSVQNSEAVNVMKDFWAFSLKGEKNESTRLVERASEKFRTPCTRPTPEITVPIDSNPDRSPSSSGQGGVSLTYLDSEYNSLINFSELINKDQRELFEVRVIKSDDNFAVLRFEYGKGDFRVAQLVLVHKDKEEWKLVTVGVSKDMSENEKIIAQNDGC